MTFRERMHLEWNATAFDRNSAKTHLGSKKPAETRPGTSGDKYPALLMKNPMERQPEARIFPMVNFEAPQKCPPEFVPLHVATQDWNARRIAKVEVAAVADTQRAGIEHQGFP
jgi:hypothetical protein